MNFFAHNKYSFAQSHGETRRAILKSIIILDLFLIALKAFLRYIPSPSKFFFLYFSCITPCLRAKCIFALTLLKQEL